MELNLPLSTLDRIDKVFKKSLRIQTLLKCQLKMFLFLVLSSSFLCLLFFFSVIRGRHVWMGNLRSLPELGFFFFFIFRVENIAFSSANSSLISLLQVFFFLSLCPPLGMVRTVFYRAKVWYPYSINFTIYPMIFQRTIFVFRFTQRACFIK